MYCWNSAHLPVPEVVTGHGCSHRIPDYDAEALGIEIDLLLDWFAPSARDEEFAEELRAIDFHEAWQSQFARLHALDTGWVLRDYHSPNLIWLPDRSGVARVGLIDYQDAQVGHPCLRSCFAAAGCPLGRSGSGGGDGDGSILHNC